MFFSKKKEKKESKKEVKEKEEKSKKSLINEKLDQGFIHCRTIVEMLGAPREYIVETLKFYVEKIKQSDKVVVLNTDFSKPKKEDKLFHIYVEIEMLVKDASELAFFCFDYMPSSIEIIQPDTFSYRAANFSSFFNDLQGRLHNLDMLAKNLVAENKNLKKNAGALLRNLVILTLKFKGDMNVGEISKNVGIPPEQLKPFLEKHIKEGHLRKEGDIYKAAK